MFLKFKIFHLTNAEIFSELAIPMSDIKLVLYEEGKVNTGTPEEPNITSVSLVQVITKNLIKKRVPVLDKNNQPTNKTRVVEDYESFTVENQEQIQRIKSQI